MPFKNANAQVESLIKEPKGATPDQWEKVRQSAIKEFGTTNNYKNAFYMFPNGQMLDGSGGQGYGRVYDHRDINSSYYENDLDFEDEQGGNTSNMLDFMRGGHIRMIPENKAIDLMAKPTNEQMNQLYKMFNLGHLNAIQISNPNDKYGQQLDYLENIQNERQIADFIRKHYN